MSPQIVCIVLIALLLGRDLWRRRVSLGTFVVLIWVAIFASRPVSAWFQSGLEAATPDGYLEGSPLDAAVFFVLIMAGMVVLLRRRIDLRAVVRGNVWLVVFFAYCGISVLWSDFPFVAFKRWFKDFGNVIMVLLLLTDREPIEATKAVFVRCAYLLVPLSFLFVRYFPEMGRVYSGYNSSDLMFVGVSTHKNAFGSLLLVSCVFLAWDVVGQSHLESHRRSAWRKIDSVLVFCISLSLLFIAHSATSLLCTFLAFGTYLATGLPFVRRKLPLIEFYAIAGFATWAILDGMFGITELLVLSLGRDMTFTSRTEAWSIVLSTQVNPWIGAGFKSFWMGDRMAELWKNLPGVVQAHSGYVETYVNGGVLGLFFLVTMLFAGFRHIKRHLLRGEEFGRVRLAFWIVTLAYNFSEASFNQLSVLWLVTLVAVMEAPRRIEDASAREDLGGDVPPRIESSGRRLAPGKVRRYKPTWDRRAIRPAS